MIDPGSGRIIDQYRVGHSPEAVAAGAGSVWFANRLDGTVTRIDRDRASATIDVGGEPSGLAFGAGSLWVADGEGRKLEQIAPQTNKVVQEIEIGNAAHAVTFGYGAVWVASAVDATIVRIDAKSGRPGRRSRPRPGRPRWRRERARSGSRATPRGASSSSTRARARRWPKFASGTVPAASPWARARCGWPTAATGPCRASTRTAR